MRDVRLPSCLPPAPLRAATTLALWAAAWQGGASADDVLSAIDDSGHRAGVRAATAEIADATGLPGPGWPSAGSAALLPVLREGGPAELLLPYPGDLRGLPLGGELTVAAPGRRGRWWCCRRSQIALVPVGRAVAGVPPARPAIPPLGPAPRRTRCWTPRSAGRPAR